MSGPNGRATADDIRKETRRLFDTGELQFSQDGSQRPEVGSRVASGYESGYFDNALLNLWNDESLSERTRREIGMSYLNDTAYVAQSGARLNEKVTKARSEAEGGFGAEFSRVLREKYVKQAQSTPGRNQTILTGRV